MPRLVILDDDAGSRDLARVIAEEMGWKVVAGGARTAARLLRGEPPALVLLDPGAATEDAPDVVRSVAGLGRSAELVAWTEGTDRATTAQLAAAGAARVIAKDDFSSLMTLLRELREETGDG